MGVTYARSGGGSQNASSCDYLIETPSKNPCFVHPSAQGAWQLIRFGKMDAGPSRAAGQRQSSFLSLPIATNFHGAAILLTQSLRKDYFSKGELCKVI
jgi:hypothetical protein